METMNRKVVTAVLVSLLLVGLTLFLVLRGREGPAVPPPSADVAAAPDGAATKGALAGDASAAGGTKPGAVEEKSKDEAPAPDPGPPLLRGRVTGEGKGI